MFKAFINICKKAIVWIVLPFMFVYFIGIIVPNMPVEPQTGTAISFICFYALYCFYVFLFIRMLLRITGRDVVAAKKAAEGDVSAVPMKYGLIWLILGAAFAVYFIGFFISMMNGTFYEDIAKTLQQFADNKTEVKKEDYSKIRYIDINPIVESVSPSGRYAIVSLNWKDNQWPYRYYLQDMKSGYRCRFPDRAVELMGIDVPSIVFWSPREDYFLIAFNAGEAAEYVRSYKIIDGEIFPKEYLRPAKDEITCKILTMRWIRSNTAVINARVLKHPCNYYREKPYFIKERYLYTKGKGFKNI